LNQKPLDLILAIIEASSDRGDVVWEPFGGLFTACIAARRLGRKAFGAEVDPTYFITPLNASFKNLVNTRFSNIKACCKRLSDSIV